MGKTSEGKQWRDFLAPTIKVLGGLLVAITVWVQSQTNTKAEAVSNSLDSRVSVLETRVSNTEHNVQSLDKKMDKVIELISDIRVDVARMAGADKDGIHK